MVFLHVSFKGTHLFVQQVCVSVCSGQQANKSLPVTGLTFQWRKTVINK